MADKIIYENYSKVFKSDHLRSLVTILFKRRLVILSVFFSVVILVTIGSFMMAPVFETSSTILVEREIEAEQALLFRMNVPKNRDPYDWIQSEIAIIKSFPAALRVVKEYVLDNDLVPGSIEEEYLYRKAKKFQKKLKVENLRNSNIIKISYEATAPLLLTDIVNKVTKVYKAYRSEIYKESDTYKFFEEQMEIADEKLRILERGRANYKNKEKIISPLTQGNILLKKLENYEESLTDVQTKRIGKEAKLEVIKEQLEMGSQINVPSTEVSESRSRQGYIAKLKGGLLDQELQKQKLLQRFKPTYQEIIDLEQDIAATKQHIRMEVLDIIQQEETSIRAHKAEELALHNSITNIYQEISEFALKEYEFTQLSRGIEDSREVYSMLRKQREEARISLAKKQRGVKIRVISPATVPFEPTKPKRKLCVFLAIILGSVGGLGFAFLAEQFDQSVSTTTELKQSTGLNVLGSVKEYEEMK